MKKEHFAWLGVGSRDGDRLAHMRMGLRRLHATPGIRVVRASSLYETEPVGLTGDAPLLNGVARLATTLEPAELLTACLAIEAEAGRVRAKPPDQGPRPLDLDILLYGERIVESASLTIPHPRLHTRNFVLAPLAEIDPDVFHPGLGLTAALLCARCPDTSWVRLVHPGEAWWP